ncbi:MAG TPA: cyclodeaminase/cyclohydrolase family protein [Pseudonocardiaceae bacterium]
MRDQTMGKYLDELADRVPAPGGGAAAALHAAQGAALVAMVARYTSGGKHTEHATVVARILDRAQDALQEALRLVEEDAAAFGAVAEAYQLPRSDEGQKAARSAAIAAALAAAARPPAAVIVCGYRIVTLAEELLPIGNRNVLTDVAAAADAARAAATTARVNVEVNLRGIRDEAERQRLRGIVDTVGAVVERADAVSAAVRDEVAG